MSVRSLVPSARPATARKREDRRLQTTKPRRTRRRDPSKELCGVDYYRTFAKSAGITGQARSSTLKRGAAVLQCVGGTGIAKKGGEAWEHSMSLSFKPGRAVYDPNKGVLRFL